jgi:hypothetical protein
MRAKLIPKNTAISVPKMIDLRVLERILYKATKIW